MKRIEKILLYIGVLSIIFSIIFISQKAEAQEMAGQCGESLNWSYDAENETLIISGQGEMDNYSRSAPWSIFKEKITQIILEDGITYIGTYAFYGCNIEKIVFPSTVKSVGEYAFDNCDNLTEIVLNEGIEEIKDYAFMDSAVKAINFPSTLKNITGKIFYRSPLEKITVSSLNPWYTSKDGVLFNKEMTVLYMYPADREISSYIVPDSVEKVGDYAFCYSKLKEIAIPDSVKNLGEGVFWGSSIESLVLPDSVISIGSHLCMMCKSLKTIEIGDGLTSLENATFFSCESLEKVKIGNSMIDLGYEAFGGCTSLKEVQLPDGLLNIGKVTFEDCTSLETINFPKSLEIIGERAFESCSSLKTVSIQSNLVEIGANAFAYCSALNLIELPEGLTIINGGAFQMTALEKVNIPASVTYIGVNAFPDNAEINTNLFKGLNGAYAKAIEVELMAEDLYSEAFEVLELVNQERQAVGASPVLMDTELLEVAMMRAHELGVFFSHSSPSGLSIPFQNGTKYGENIAIGQTNANQAVQSWMNSSQGHRENILDADHTKVGIGVAKINGKYCWVQIFSNGTLVGEAVSSSYADEKKIVKIPISVTDEQASPEIILSDSRLLPGQKADINLKIWGLEITSEHLIYSSSDSKICSVSEDGEVIGLTSGNAELIVKLKRYPDICWTLNVSVSDYEMGDLDSSGNVDIADLRLVLRAVCGKVELTDAQTSMADVETDGKVDIQDLRKILRFVCGKIESLE